MSEDGEPARPEPARPQPGSEDAANPERVRVRVRRRVSRREQRRRKREKWIILSALGVGALAVIAIAWVIVTAFFARNRLNDIQARLATVKQHALAGDIPALQRDEQQLKDLSSSADFLTSGPAWWFAAHVPWAGAPFESVRGITSAVDDLAHTTVPQLVALAQNLDPSTLRQPDGSIAVDKIVKAVPTVDASTAHTAAIRNAVQNLPASTWLNPVDAGRTKLLTKLDSLLGALQAADRAANILPPMLGAKTPQRYFVGFLNEAEIRGTGGLPGAFIIVEVDHGRIRTTHRESDDALNNVKSGVTPTKDFRQLYASGRPWNLYLNSTMSPNFPDVARIWAGMWQQKSGEHIDGAIAIDPTALSYLLAVTGPAAAPDGTSVNAGNVVALTQKDVYAKYPGSVTDAKANAQRRKYLLDISAAAEAKILTSGSSVRSLIEAVSRAAGERRILAWSRDPTVQNQLAQTDFAGTIPLTQEPFTGVALQNAAANKLAYYLDRSFSYVATSCDSTREATVTVTLTNRAPTSGLSPYVTGSNNPSTQNKLVVQVYSTVQAHLDGATLNGKPWKLGRFTEQRHAVYLTLLTLPVNQPQTLVLHIRETAVRGPVTVLNPPGVRPMTTSINACQ